MYINIHMYMCPYVQEYLKGLIGNGEELKYKHWQIPFFPHFVIIVTNPTLSDINTPFSRNNSVQFLNVMFT